MHAKKSIGVLVAVSSLVLLAGCGSAQPATINNAKTVEVTTGTKTVEVPTNLSKNDQCIEIMAYSLKGAEYQQKGDLNAFMEWAKKVDAIIKSYNLDEKSYQDLCKGFVLDPNFMQKVQARVKQL